MKGLKAVAVLQKRLATYRNTKIWIIMVIVLQTYSIYEKTFLWYLKEFAMGDERFPRCWALQMVAMQQWIPTPWPKSAVKQSLMVRLKLVLKHISLTLVNFQSISDISRWLLAFLGDWKLALLTGRSSCDKIWGSFKTSSSSLGSKTLESCSLRCVSQCPLPPSKMTDVSLWNKENQFNSTIKFGTVVSY